MKLHFLISASLFLTFACTNSDQPGSHNDDEFANLPAELQHKIEKIDYLDTAYFRKAGVTIDPIDQGKFENSIAFEHKMLIEKFCKKSKGYQHGIWEGENDCSWAMEKYRLEKLAQWASRNADTLILNLQNDTQIELPHNRSVPTQIQYYQLKNYLPKAGFYVVESIQNGKCKNSLLINTSNGDSYPLNGSLYFADDEATFLAASFSKELPLSCNNSIELYNIVNSQIEKKWHVPTGEWGTSDAIFISPKEALLEQCISGIPTYYKRYAELTLAD